MKNYLLERFISGLWLSLLGFLFVYNSQALMSTPVSGLFFDILVAGFFFLLGYFRGYKILLLPANQLNLLPLKCIAGVYFSIFMVYLTESILHGVFNFSEIHFITVLIILSVVVSIAFLIGWFYLFRLLLFPQATYLKEFPGYKHRIIAAIWFGVIGFIFAYLFKAIVMPVYGFLLASYFGFTVGYRILLLSTPKTGYLKSMMIGFIWSSYALLIVWLMFSIPSFFFEADSKMSVANGINDLGASIAFLCVFFPIISVFICVPTMVFSVLFYLGSRMGKF